ncbi:MAG: TRAP transporter large permease [Alphaproteobacteria bacterium]|nr:TRAP transporter large permease [Alphaproteobacteria bacterium]
MDPTTVAILGIVIMLGLIAFGVPIAFSMAIVGAGGYWILVGFKPAMTQVYINSYQKGSELVFIALPLFILMGQLVYHSRIAVDLYDCVQKWFGRLPGGLAITSVAGCAGFGAVTGSSVAAVATIAPMSMPEMRRYKYDSRLATGSLASAGTLAMLIPPSVILVAYGIWTETSIGHLFIAGVIPGIVLASMYALYIWGRCLINPEMGPIGPKYSWSEKFGSLYKLAPIIAIFTIVLGGIYAGIFTPTEAAGIGVSGVFLVTLVMGRVTWEGTKAALLDAGRTSAMIFAIIVGGHIIGAFLNVSGVTPGLINWVSELGVNKYVVIAIFVVIYLILGAILDVWGMLILTLPFVFPVVTELGFDPVWFGIFIVIMVEIALITPPIGINVYVMHNLAPDVPLGEIFKGVAPFVVVSLIFVVLLTAFPEMALFLVELAFG